MTVRAAVVDIDLLNAKVIDMEKRVTHLEAELVALKREHESLQRAHEKLEKKAGTSAVKYG